MHACHTHTNQGFTDVECGKAIGGVQIVPLRTKIFSGWESRAAIRKLSGISAEKREEIRKGLLTLRRELQGKPYEKSKVDLILSSFDFGEDSAFLKFLKNDEEDLSSIFCSELVAMAYQRLGLLAIGDGKTTCEYTPDDFTSKEGLQLNGGKLEEEVFIEIKF